MVENHFEWFLTDRFGKLYYFDKSKIILGRKDCDIHLKSNSVDYKHCILSINEKDKTLKIKDLETSNGTFINEKQIKPNNFKNLNVGDKIRLAYDQITFTVQKKSVVMNVNVTDSPSRGIELPSVVTDPERCMTPVVCEMTDSQGDMSKSVEKIIERNEKIDEKQEYSKTIKTQKIKSQEIQKILKPEIPIVKEFIGVQVKEKFIVNLEDLNTAQSKPAESFTIDFANNEINDGESLSSVGLSRFVPSKLRSSFEGREKVNRTKLQYSNSLNKSSDSPRFGKNEIKILPAKPTKVNNLNKGKLDSKPSETLTKVKTFNLSKKIPEKNFKTKSESSSKPFQKQLKASSENINNNNKDKNKSVKNTIINSKNITPTLSKRNSKSYLLEKMLMGDESYGNFANFDEHNKEDEKVTEIVLPIINNENYVPPVIDDAKISIKTTQEFNDAASESGTYVIENEANEKTVDTEDTLEKDDVSTISSTRFNTQELESKSSTKWLSEFPTDDVIMESESKSKRNTNTKFTGCSMPHIPSSIPIENEKNYRDEDSTKINNSILVNDLRTRNPRVPPYNAGDPNNNLNSEEINSWAVNDSDSNKKASNSKLNSQSYQQVPISPYVMGNQSLLVAEDVYVSDVMTNSTVPTNNYSRNSNLPQKSKEMDLFSLNFSSTQPNSNYHPRSTYSVASLDTALLLQDTEALLNDMEKRVYSRREIKTEEFTRIQPFSTSFPQSEKIPYVDDGEEREEDTSLFNYSADIEESVRLSNHKQQTSLSNHNDSMSTEEKNRSYSVRSPISSGIIRRNNSCKVGVSESIVTQSNIAARKLNSTIRNQRSCSLIEERKLNHNNNNNNNNSNNNIETFSDHRNKPKLSLLAMNSGTFVNRRGSGGYSSALNSPIGKFEPISAFNSSFPVQKSKEAIPYISNNMLSVHRQKFNRYEYGQHSLKYNSNSTTMLYNKYNNTSPPWNMDDINNINQNSVYPNYDTDYLYNTMPEPFEASMLFLKHEPNIIENMNHQQAHFDSNTDSDFQRRDDIVEFSQTGNISGRSSAFSPVNSLHQSTESVNNFQITNKSRSSLGLNEQRLYNYDFLLVSSIHLYSARLCRYTEEIVHRLRREDPEYKGSSPIDSALEQSDSFGQLKSANRELQETLNNMRSLEKQLQKIEKSVFPPEKSGRNSTLGSCTEDSYLNQLERINKELEDFVPIDDEKNSRNSTSAKPSTRQEYSYLKTKDTKPTNQTSITKSQQTVEKSKSKSRADTKLDQTKNSFSSSDICSPTKSKYSSLSKRFQHRKD